MLGEMIEDCFHRSTCTIRCVPSLKCVNIAKINVTVSKYGSTNVQNITSRKTKLNKIKESFISPCCISNLAKKLKTLFLDCILCVAKR